MSNEARARAFVGRDWAVHTHAVCPMDAAGSELDRLEVAHDRHGLTELMPRLARHGQRLRIAIAQPSGLIVAALVDAGHRVFPFHHSAVKPSRPRYCSHGAKSSAADAYLPADLLRTDSHRRRAIAPQSGDIRALRALVRSRDDLEAARAAEANQMTSTLQSFRHGTAVIFADLASPIALACLRSRPSPRAAKRLTEAHRQCLRVCVGPS